MKLSDLRVLEALTYLRGNPYFETFLRDGLPQYIKFYTERVITSDGTIQTRAAGAVEALRDLETTIRDAAVTLEKAKQAQVNRKVSS